ncbi:hypothetical protein LSH36_17g07033 [Paralvinella palmiformis]|uniref:Uncharacterized protein n=1 Tax=Paralvinella palmiformis TaxID=53620 RepID=A0AAD9NHE7_9ANNE|nr:hypothetical protein LSH36_17g07033 [Paralvinella palmiformis]
MCKVSTYCAVKCCKVIMHYHWKLVVLNDLHFTYWTVPNNLDFYIVNKPNEN